MNSDLERHKN
jgi:hypothetical protein